MLRLRICEPNNKGKDENDYGCSTPFGESKSGEVEDYRVKMSPCLASGITYKDGATSASTARIPCGARAPSATPALTTVTAARAIFAMVMVFVVTRLFLSIAPSKVCASARAVSARRTTVWRGLDG